MVCSLGVWMWNCFRANLFKRVSNHQSIGGRSAYCFPLTVVLAFLPSITTSMVEPRFSNSADWTVGKLSCRVPGATVVADVAVMSMGDWTLFVEQPAFSAAKAAHPVLITVRSGIPRVQGLILTGLGYQCIRTWMSPQSLQHLRHSLVC
jgi:hypothetical protein